MTITVANFQGRTSTPGMRKSLSKGLGWLIALLGTLFAVNALAAENVLQDITYTPLSGGKVQIVLKFSGAVGEPQIFTTENPARIAIDMANTRNGMSQRRIEINSGATGAVSAV